MFDALVDGVPWQAERRQMYDRTVDVPRLLKFYGEGESLPHPLLTAAMAALNVHYESELGEPFRTAGLCYYRDGRDSVAWHGDTIGRGSHRPTPWWRSCPSVPPVPCISGHARSSPRQAPPGRCGTRSGTVT